MIVAAAFCPNPPVLVPGIAQGAAPELDDLRAACAGAITRVVRPGRPIVLLGSGPVSRAHAPTARGTFAGYGVDLDVALGASAGTGRVELPLSLSVGAWLLRDALGPDTGAVGFSVGPDFWGSAAEQGWRLLADADELALIVLGDGSARRSTAAPGYLDERAEAFDAAVSAAMRGGDGTGFDSAHLDPDLAADLLAAGAPAWEVAGNDLQGRHYDAELLYDRAPYGVGYFVAAWT